MKVLFDLIKPALWYLGVIAAVVYGLHLNRQDGYDEGYNLGKSDGDTEVADLRQAYTKEKQTTAEAATTAANKIIADLRAEQAKGNQLASQLADTKDNLRKTTDKLTGEIAHVTKRYRRALDAQPEPLPVAVFTTGFVRVWNTANGISTAMPTPNGTSGAAAPPSGAGTADDLDSGVSQAQVLTNQVRNGERHGICRAQLNDLIDWTLNESR
ncbi:DNA-packaging protein [Pseudomonas frederiksbergensis]|uniref:DNA-packaging protein n=1 Tax=Pseudomonas frederiksbergensis TaxID=104087 RepID=A0A1J0EKA9_9PSED|nr:DNA-packaging protein [Pseudomonas frederiksbergensis]APC16304.1 DNA-packaging protein [Pseudomonas frederiksbergensis]